MMPIEDGMPRRDLGFEKSGASHVFDQQLRDDTDLITA